MSDEIVHLTVNGHRPRVAIVGGTPAGATVATILVGQFGCEPVCAPSGEKMLALLRHDSAIDMIMLDNAMPDMDAVVAVQLVRALGRRGTLPVLALTDDRQQVAGSAARAAGFAGAVVKPYSPRELYLAMQGVLARTAAPARLVTA
jgi:two-component system chemotaxis sensor kinase CheA